jgi:hypothetical protein
MFLLKQNDSDILKVNQASKARLAKLDKQWEELKSRSEEIKHNHIPAYNKLLWDHGMEAPKTKHRLNG